jgi:hypothetical protein
VYNTPPAISPSKFEALGQPFCVFPQSQWPPQDANNPETYLNSAYWPGEERPDLEKYAIEDDGGYTRDDYTAELPHYCLLVDAEAAGYPITHTPKLGEIIEFQENCVSDVQLNGPGAPTPYTVNTTPVPASCTANGGGGWYDGYVSQVLPDGSFIVYNGGWNSQDSAIGAEWMSPAMDSQADFIGLMPASKTNPNDPGSGTGTSRGSGGTGGGSTGGSSTKKPSFTFRLTATRTAIVYTLTTTGIKSVTGTATHAHRLTVRHVRGGTFRVSVPAKYAGWSLRFVPKSSQGYESVRTGSFKIPRP